MRSPFIERREDILPRSLRELLAAEAAAQPGRARPGDDRPRRRQRRLRTVRRAP
ncbi:hypothetical protein [Actinomadura bangladeshensis]|uniref:Uncharacterized protein n=1 Tax=Actinomadura bangladeshensis TaxID=453573 RepID=A0A6L9QUB5_9ACTN|nr:hypothetical protein [Actinomadura bangladeshensis]NEA27564.1 hypothetical protein [Actinomadura bangladeshensis]